MTKIDCHMLQWQLPSQLQPSLQLDYKCSSAIALKPKLGIWDIHSGSPISQSLYLVYTSISQLLFGVLVQTCRKMHVMVTQHIDALRKALQSLLACYQGMTSPSPDQDLKFLDSKFQDAMFPYLYSFTCIETSLTCDFTYYNQMDQSRLLFSTVKTIDNKLYIKFCCRGPVQNHGLNWTFGPVLCGSVHGSRTSQNWTRKWFLVLDLPKQSSSAFSKMPTLNPCPPIYPATDPLNPPSVSSDPQVVPDFAPALSAAHQKAKNFISDYTIEEKVNITTGVASTQVIFEFTNFTCLISITAGIMHPL
ncbi:hypothetical protein BDR06DRAFT_976426 [Suillus hirtellus]|nr:hypothetical protein BDR06DRAFT_976426 [Suillus hirtellus]